MASIELQNLLLPKVNTQIKIKFDYNLTIDDIERDYKYKTKFLTINSGNLNIPTDIPLNIKRFVRICVYLLYDYDAYLYTYIIVPIHDINIIKIEHGINQPIIRINDTKAYRVDHLHRYSCYRMICCCGSIQAALNDIEDAEDDYNRGCVIS